VAYAAGLPDRCSGPAPAAVEGGILALVLLADLAYMGRSGVPPAGIPGP